jgi:hypothetical protein
VSTLKEILLSAETRPKVVRDAVQLVDDEVHAKGGLSGIAIKTAYKAVRAIKPGLIEEAVDSLVDRFIERLEPFYAEWSSGPKTQPIDQFLSGQRSKVANALLGVTDERAAHASNGTIRKSYQALRPQGEKNVEAAVPGLARLISRYVKA